MNIYREESEEKEEKKRLGRARTLNFKMFISGDVVEIYHYNTPLIKGLRYKRIAGIRGSASVSSEEKQLVNTKTAHRARNKVRRLVNANITQWKDDEGNPSTPFFVTLTFAENITDLKEAHKHFTDYTKRLNYLLFGINKSMIKYLAVPEFQKRGAVHYHIIYFNLPSEIGMGEYERTSRQIAETWSHGFVDVRPITGNYQKVAGYMTKYLNKAWEDERLWNRKKYFASKGLKKPLHITHDELVKELIMSRVFTQNLQYRTYANVYNSKYNDQVVFNQFVFPKELTKDLLYLRKEFYRNEYNLEI